MSGGVSDTKILKGPRFGIRHAQILLLFLNISTVYMSRLSISVLIVAMTNAATTNPDFPEFDWSEKEKNYIISTFYWGYMVTQFPAGYIIRRFGAKIVMFTSTFCSAIFTLFTPYLVTIGSWQAYCGIRVVHGLLQGALFPCINDHIAKWSPPQERQVLGALAYSGISGGTVASILFSGLIANSSVGWPGISYISGGVCIMWSAAWLIFGAKDPPSSRYITKEECQYIESSLNRGRDFHKKKIPIPWRAMFNSLPFLALIFARATEVWTFTTLQNQLPSYMNGILNKDITNNALFSSLPYILRWIMTYVFTFFGEMAVAKGWLNITNMRKIANTLGTWIPTILLFCIGFLGAADSELVISLFIVCIGIEAGSSTGALLGTIDLAPNHASVVMSIINSICCLIPFATPLVVGAIVTDVHNRSEWQIVFGISATVGFFGNLVYIIFCSSEAAPWDAPDFLLKHQIEEPTKNVELESTVERFSNFDNSIANVKESVAKSHE